MGHSFEVVVVDDASSDRTATIAREHGARVIAVSHRQIAATRNAGAGEASGELFVFLDADTVVNCAVIRRHSLHSKKVPWAAAVRSNSTATCRSTPAPLSR